MTIHSHTAVSNLILVSRSRAAVLLCVTALSLFAPASLAEEAPTSVDAEVQAVESKVVSWRRDIHQHPELGFEEKRTAKLVAEHLRRLGFDEVRTGIAHTGVLGILKGKHPGGAVALRADMDALPIKENTGLPFASKAVATIDGKKVPVMHACGHDAHVAMLMGAAEVLAGMRDRISGTVLFVFQPAEEGVDGYAPGAALMMREGLFSPVKPDAIFGLHVEPGPVGRIDVRPGPLLSSASSLRITLTGRQTHAGRPWEGTDIINMSADVIQALARISSRQVNVFDTPNVVSIGSVQAGNRGNVIPGEAVLEGTIRTFDIERRDRLKDLIESSVQGIAQGYDAKADVRIEDIALVTGSDPKILDTIMPALEAAAGEAGVRTDAPLRGAAEDFSYFQKEIPGVYYIIGSTPDFTTMEEAFTNHSDRFDIDESVLAIGVKAHVLTALTFLDSHKKRSDR